MEMIDVSAEQLNIILNILKQHVPEYEVRAFGSRYKWTAKDYSDLDLAVVGETKLDWKIISNLKEAFEESDLPFRVDILDWHAISPEFRALIETGFEVIQKPLPVRDRTQTEGLDMRDGGWKKVKLGEISKDIAYGYTASASPKPVGPKFLRITDIVGGLNWDTVPYCKIDESKHKKYKLKTGDIVIARTGATTGTAEIIKKESDAVFASYLIRFEIDENKADPFYIGFVVKSNEWKEFVKSIIGGSAQPGANAKQFSEFEFSLPPIPTQTRIASILSALDDKIELNRQTNQTLEAIAQAIFKEWFVDFRFPHSPLEGCPKGGVESLHAKPASLPSWQKNSLFPFWTLPKNHKLKERAKELRKQGILSEVVFWKAFKDKKKLGWDIDRQVIIGNFIVDFFIPELGLVFEIDGSSHNDKQEYDQERDAFLSSLQLKVVRISDKDVLRNIEGVWSFVTESIKDRVEELKAKSPPRPSGTPQEGKKCEMQDSELGPIPKGWRVGKLGEIVEVKGGTTPSTKEEKYWSGKHHWATPKDLSNLTSPILLDTERRITKEGVAQISSGILPKGTLLLSSRAPIGYLAISDIPISINQGFIAINSKETSNLFILHWLKENMETVISRANGSTFLEISKTNFKEIDIIIPDADYIKMFDAVVLPIYECINNTEHQSATLTAIRDALLPKLMNGEIEV